MKPGNNVRWQMKMSAVNYNHLQKKLVIMQLEFWEIRCRENLQQLLLVHACTRTLEPQAKTFLHNSAY